jgi:transcription initiation factor IIE alpha subunit
VSGLLPTKVANRSLIKIASLLNFLQMKGGNMSEQYKDKFSKASAELSEKSAFICKSCDTKYSKKEAHEKANTCCGRTLTELQQEGFGP